MIGWHSKYCAMYLVRSEGFALGFAIRRIFPKTIYNFEIRLFLIFFDFVIILGDRYADCCEKAS